MPRIELIRQRWAAFQLEQAGRRKARKSPAAIHPPSTDQVAHSTHPSSTAAELMSLGTTVCIHGAPEAI